MPTRDQERAAKIFEQVSGLPAGAHKKYGAMAHKLPILVRTAGLAQALEFVNTRSSDVQQQILDHLADVVGVTPRKTLLDRSRTADLDEYMWLTREVLAALQWYKRFAQSVLHVTADEEGDVT